MKKQIKIIHRHTSYKRALCDLVTEDTTIFDANVTCKKCKKGKIVKRKGAYGDFYACNKFPTCRCIYEKDPGNK